MATMTTAEKNLTIKSSVLDELRNTPVFENAVQIGDFEFAIPVEVDGEQRYCAISLTAKSNKDTKTTVAFNAEDAHNEYLDTVAVKAAKAEEKAKVKAEKLAKKASK